MEHKNKNTGLPPAGIGLKFSREMLEQAALMVAEGKMLPLKGDIPFKLFLSRETESSKACLRSMPGTVEKNLQKAAWWCTFVSGSDKPKVLSELAATKEWKEEFDMAMNACREISEEERAWAYHLSMDRAEADYNNGLMLAEQKGREDKAIETARNMLARNYAMSDISEITGLPLEEVEKLGAELSVQA